MKPSLFIMKPEPRLWRFNSLPLGSLKNLLKSSPKNSSKGPLNSGKGIMGLSFMTCVVDMLTTTGESFLASSTKLLGTGPVTCGLEFASFQKLWAIVWVVMSYLAVNIIPAITEMTATRTMVFRPNPVFFSFIFAPARMLKSDQFRKGEKWPGLEGPGQA